MSSYQCDINIKDSIRQCVFHSDCSKIFFPVKIDIFKMYKIYLDLNRVGHAVADYVVYALLSFGYPHMRLYFPNQRKSDYDICGLCKCKHTCAYFFQIQISYSDYIKKTMIL